MTRVLSAFVQTLVTCELCPECSKYGAEKDVDGALNVLTLPNDKE